MGFFCVLPMIVPTLCVGMQPGTLRVQKRRDAERHRRRYHAERGNDLDRGVFGGAYSGAGWMISTQYASGSLMKARLFMRPSFKRFWKSQPSASNRSHAARMSGTEMQI